MSVCRTFGSTHGWHAAGMAGVRGRLNHMNDINLPHRSVPRGRVDLVDRRRSGAVGDVLILNCLRVCRLIDNALSSGIDDDGKYG
jgi:hypothetical protein